ncbi:ATP synthase complex subunit H-domain-containing protein [Dipodascopsis tothii]|uniref:ATP synthase complex subunit H-domain-containing protein n=1 Tax=Dipodascopsis tothii TaxID=44089 RepID=UPI0034CF39DA
MFSQTLRAVSRTAVPAFTRRFGTSVPRRADIIQDLYLKELKAYKAPTIKATDSEGQVKPWSVPKAPAVPAFEGTAEADVTAYEAQAVEVEGVEAAAVEEPDVEDWFVIEEIEDHH